MDPQLLEFAIVAFTAFFATIGPVDVAAVAAGLLQPYTPKERRAVILRATGIATALLLLFILAGREILDALGITLAALRTAGGILLLLIAINMVFAQHTGGTGTTEEEAKEASKKADISVFPLATPLLAGPGAMGLSILLAAEAGGDPAKLGVVAGAMTLCMLIALVLLFMAGQVRRVLGVTGLNVITRVIGVLLAALAVQFIFDGIKDSGLVG